MEIKTSPNKLIARKSSVRKSIINLGLSSIEEEKLISEFTTTAYEKVLKILDETKYYLEDLDAKEELITNLDWVIKKITSHTLYTYEVVNSGGNEEMKGEINNLAEFLSDYSEIKDYQKKNQDNNARKKISRRTLNFGSQKNSNLKFNLPVNIKEKKNDIEFIEDESISSFAFNIFDFEKNHSRKAVYPSIANFSFKYLDVMNEINTENFSNFCVVTRDKYLDGPYHNSLHAADVCQTMLVFITKGELSDKLHLHPVDVVSLIISSLLHDLGHPSQNNGFQMNTYSDIAITYNDRSVLENFHISESFRILRNPQTNILTKFNDSDYKVFRKRIIEQILSTDMITHAKTLSLVKNRIVNTKYSNFFIDPESPSIFEEQQEVLNFLVHTADISHSAKEFDISFKWTYLIMEEFWMQGDKEKSMNLTVSFLCDRDTADVPKGQVFFVRGIILPNFEALCEISEELEPYLQNVEINLNQWIQKSEENEMNKEISMKNRKSFEKSDSSVKI